MKGLELKHFKKVKSEDNHTTLRHYAGHEIRIKHSALSTKMREQLEALPMQKAQSATQEDGGKVAEPIKMADGGKAPKVGTSEGYTVRPEGDEMTRVTNQSGRMPVPGSKYPSSASLGASGAGMPFAPKMNEEGEQFAKGGPVGPMNPKLAESKKTPPKMYADGTPNEPISPEEHSLYQKSGGEAADASLNAPIASPQGADEASDPRLAELASTASTGQGDPTFDPEVAKSEAVGPQPPNPEDAATQRKHQLYNQYKTQNFDPNAPSTMPGLTFGPNGEPPKTFDPKAAQEAETAYQQEQKQNAAATGAKLQAAADENKIRAQWGQPLVTPTLPSGGPAPEGKAFSPYAAGPATAPKPPEEPGMMEGYAGNMSKGYGLQEKAIEEQKQSAQQSAQAQQELLGQAAQQNQNQINEQQKRIAAFQKSNQDFIHDVQAGYIKPKDMFHDKNTGSKVSTAIGLLLGGMSAGMTGQGNPALDFMNKQIDRDMQAQHQNLAAKENLLHHNLQQFNDINTATAVTRMQYNDYYAHMIDKAKASAATPAAQAAADMAKGELLQKNAMIMSMLGQHGSIPGQSGGAGGTEQYLNMLRMTNPAMAKEIESRYVPGVGVASIPLSETTRSTLTERKVLGDNIRQLQEFQKKYGGTLDGIGSPTIRSQGEALARQVQDQYRRANQQGVFKPAEAAFVNGVIADSPSSLFSKYTKAPAYKAAADINQGNLDALYSSVGLKPQGGAPQGSTGFVPKTFKPAR